MFIDPTTLPGLIEGDPINLSLVKKFQRYDPTSGPEIIFFFIDDTEEHYVFETEEDRERAWGMVLQHVQINQNTIT